MSQQKLEPKLATAKLFTIQGNRGEIHCVALASTELFGKADTILVSEDRKTWIAHPTDEFMDAISNGKPIRVS